ncbi:glutathione S-transferase family protein [Phenylobacterium aquaticum]|uniref:glutathione S-transferase family protein n=1 Tax=Phenylobacterium aquaticum TaxID=1763816 RepID=UPI0026EB8EB4|nr:glutathione S-transferase family protein [Phenylobacterium aquaticum]
MRLYSGPLSMFGAKAEIAALEKGLPVRVFMVPYDPNTGYEPKHPDVLRVNPKRQVPVLIDEGLEIFDSTQIFEYFEHLKPDPALWPASPKARAEARLIEHKADEVYFPHVVRLMGLEETPDDPAAVAARAAAARFHLEVEGLLAGREYLAGAFSYADIGVYMATLFGERKGAVAGSDTPRLRAWRDRMSERPAVRQVAGAMAAYLVSIGRSIPPFMAELLQPALAS